MAEEIDQLDFSKTKSVYLNFAQGKLHELFNSDWLLSVDKNKKTF